MSLPPFPFGLSHLNIQIRFLFHSIRYLTEKSHRAAIISTSAQYAAPRDISTIYTLLPLFSVFPACKVRPGRAADHSPPSSAAVMQAYSYTSNHPLGHTGPVTGSLFYVEIRSFSPFVRDMESPAKPFVEFSWKLVVRVIYIRSLWNYWVINRRLSTWR